MLKKYGFLFGSLAVLVVGLICLLACGMGYTTLVLLLIGILCTVASMFASLPMPDDEQFDIEPKREISDQKVVENTSKPVVLPPKKHKIVCKYCKNRFPCNADKCPYCGAPVDVSSLSPECLEPIPHEMKIEISTPKTKTANTSKKKTTKST